MDAISSNRSNFDYSGAAPVLVTASSEPAMARALRTVEAAGHRVGARLPLKEARERIGLQGSASAVWIELDEDCGGPMDELLLDIRRDVADGRYGAVVSAPIALLDPVTAAIGDSDIQLIVDAGDAERAAAIALVTFDPALSARIADVAGDRSADRLRQLSDEVSRIAATLARLSTGPTPAPPAIEAGAMKDAPELAVETVRSVIRARRLRARYFSEELFADPAWDMLLDLLQAELSQLRVPVSSLCIAAAVPATTALRWLKTMVQQGLFLRRADPHDGRRVFVELAPEASSALRRYFAELAASGPAPAVI
jgi:DNA-binding MarR family transcriptional regulator